MRKLQLIYFNLRALCEAPRMMLHNAEIEYSYEMAWNYFKKPWSEIKKDVIFHKLPLLVIDEKIEIWQSNTISRYIAKITNNLQTMMKWQLMQTQSLSQLMIYFCHLTQQ